MAVKGKREGPISPVLFKFGVALAFSLGGIVFTFIRSKRIMLPKPNHSSPSPGKGSKDDSDGGADQGALENSSIPRVPSANTIGDVSSSGDGSVGDRDGFFLSEFDQLVKEFDMATDYASQRKNGHSLEPNVDPPKEGKCVEHEEQERELRSLRSKVEILEEREKTLENQLLEYYGLKEQEKAVLELQNRLRVHNMEAKLYNLKIESLQSDNKMLQSKVADYEKVVAELESSHAKIKLLRKKLRFEAEQNREQILKLQERVMKLQVQEKHGIEIDQDVDAQSQERILREELEKMRKYNHSLKLENVELAQKIENVQMLAKSVLNENEVQALREESQLLRQQNENFIKEIDQLQADRCSDVEELVYLRWINACLRYELRNYQPGPNETIARDLSKSLSPKSEEKAKSLILAYANREGSGIKDMMSIGDFDCEEWSISHSSYLSDSGEPDDLSADNLLDNKTNHPSKKKLFTKLMKLLRGKDSDHHIQTPSSLRKRAASVDDVVNRYSVTSHSGISGTDDGLTKTTTTSSGSSSRQSFDLQRSHPRSLKSASAESSSYPRRMSDDGSLSIFRTIDSLTGYDDNSSSGFQPGQEAQSAAKTELVKYAEALKSSRPRQSFRRRSVSFGSF